MKALASIALRETLERKSVFAVAAGIGLLPILSLQFKGFGVLSGRSGITAIAPIAVIMFTLGLSILIGASVIGRDLAERRLGFYFARPVSDLTIWGGKFIGGLLLIFGAAFLCMLPAGIYLGGFGEILFTPKDTVISLIVTLLFYAFGLVMGVMFKTKSPLLVADLILAPLMTVFGFFGLKHLLGIVGYAGNENIYYQYNRIQDYGLRYNTFAVSIFGLVGVVLVGLLLASAISFVVGRTDTRRLHRVLSMTLWGTVLSGLLLLYGYSYWLVAAAPSDLESMFGVTTTAQGRWVELSGHAWGRGDYTSNFLVDTSSGRFIKLEKPSYSLRFSNDGKRAVWLEYDGNLSKDSTADLVTMNLDDPKAKPVRTKLSFPLESRPDVFLSDDGSRVGVIRGKMVSIFQLSTEKELVTVALQMPQGSNGYIERALFVTPDRLRFCRGIWNGSESNGPSSMEIYELDATTQKLEMTGRIDRPHAFYIISDSADRILLKQFRENSAELYDAKSGALITIIPAAKDTGWSARFLSDGRIALGEVENNEARLRILTAAGVEEKRIDLGAFRVITLGGETSTGKLIVGLSPVQEYPQYNHSRLFLVDLAAGTVTPKGEGLAPVPNRFWAEPVSRSEPGSEATKIFYNGNSIVHLDLESGERRTVLTIKATN